MNTCVPYQHLVLLCEVKECNAELLFCGTERLQLLQYVSKHLRIDRIGGDGRGGEGRGGKDSVKGN